MFSINRLRLMLSISYIQSKVTSTLPKFNSSRLIMNSDVFRSLSTQSHSLTMFNIRLTAINSARLISSSHVPSFSSSLSTLSNKPILFNNSCLHVKSGGLLMTNSRFLMVKNYLTQFTSGLTRLINDLTR